MWEDDEVFSNWIEADDSFIQRNVNDLKKQGIIIEFSRFFSTFA